MPPLILVFFYDMNFQIIKINGLDKIILRESGFIMALEIPDRSIKPDRLSKIEPVAYFIQRAEHLVRPRILPGIFDDGISDQMIIFKYFPDVFYHAKASYFPGSLHHAK